MPNKIFDIIPPEKKLEENNYSKNPEKRGSKKRFLMTMAVCILLIFFVSSVIGSLLFSSAEIYVWPQTKFIELEKNILVDFGSENPSKEALVAELATNEKNVQREFNSTGKTQKESKATGKVIIYNEYSDSSRTLIPSRIVSADGRLFWTLEKVTIPGRIRKGSKIIPGEIEVQVESAEAGRDYNIGPTTFAFPALAGSALYTTIYAKSFSPMVGGSIGEALQVTEGDLKSAENALLEELKTESIFDLKSGLLAEQVLFDGAVDQKITENISSKKAGDVANSFVCNLSLASRGIVFKKENSKQLVSELLNQNKEPEMEIDEDSVEVEYFIESIDFTQETAILKLKVRALSYRNVDAEGVKKALAGKSNKEAGIFLESLDAISKIEFKSKPFFSRKVPKEPERIHVFIKLD